MADSVRDGRTHGFYIVQNALLDQFGAAIGPNGLAVYNALARMADRGGESWPAVGTLARRLGISENTVRRGLAALKDAGLVAIETRNTPDGQTSNLYRLLDVSPATPQPEPTRTKPAANGLGLWDRLIGKVQDAQGNAAKIGALCAVWAECFGVTLSHSAAGKLAETFGSPEQAAQEALKVAAKFPPPIVNPFGLVMGGARYKPGQRGNTPPRRELPDLGTAGKVKDRASEDDGVPF